MGRKSALTDKQWVQIEARLLAGETCRGLAREFGIAESAIRKRLGAQSKQIKAVALQVVAAEEAFNALPISARVSARTLIDDLKAISTHLAGAGKFGAATAHRLSGIANAQVDKISDINPMESQEVLQGISALTKMANDSSQIGMTLLSANKEQLKELTQLDRPVPQRVTVTVVDASMESA